jgi:hypothetical protein
MRSREGRYNHKEKTEEKGAIRVVEERIRRMCEE